ncbi:hypothetical protein J6590_102801 [Homalodisca vitripennis]|nr:hypothetical protein J6590_102801 [Homalodisca vitripennis]
MLIFQVCPSLSYKNDTINASHRLQDEITKTKWHVIANSGSAKIDVRSLAEIVERCGVPQVGQVILVFMTTCATTMLLPFRGPQTFRYSLGDPAKCRPLRRRHSAKRNLRKLDGRVLVGCLKFPHEYFASDDLG